MASGSRAVSKPLPSSLTGIALEAVAVQRAHTSALHLLVVAFAADIAHEQQHLQRLDVLNDSTRLRELVVDVLACLGFGCQLRAAAK